MVLMVLVLVTYFVVIVSYLVIVKEGIVRAKSSSSVLESSTVACLS